MPTTYTTLYQMGFEVAVDGAADASGGNGDIATAPPGMAFTSGQSITSEKAKTGTQSLKIIGTGAVEFASVDLGVAKTRARITGSVLLTNTVELIILAGADAATWNAITKAYALNVQLDQAGWNISKKMPGFSGVTPAIGGTATANEWYDFEVTLDLPTFSYNLRRASTGFWLQTDGSFSATKPAFAQSTTDADFVPGRFWGIGSYAYNGYVDNLKIEEIFTSADPGITSVDVTPDTATATDQTPIQFSVDVVAVNGASTAGTWSCTAGSITQGGLFTPPVRTSSAQTVMVRFTSGFDPTKYNDSVVSLPALPPQSADAYLLTGAGVGTVGVAQTLTITPQDGGYTGTIALSDGSGGTFSPASLSWANEMTAKTVQYTPAQAGSRTVSGAANPALGTNQTLAVAAAAAPVSTGVVLQIQLPVSDENTGISASLNYTVVSSAGVVKVARSKSGIAAVPNIPCRYGATIEFVRAEGDVIIWDTDDGTLTEITDVPAITTAASGNDSSGGSGSGNSGGSSGSRPTWLPGEVNFNFSLLESCRRLQSDGDEPIAVLLIAKGADGTPVPPRDFDGEIQITGFGQTAGVWNPATLSGSRFILPVVGAGSALSAPLAAGRTYALLFRVKNAAGLVLQSQQIGFTTVS